MSYIKHNYNFYNDSNNINNSLDNKNTNESCLSCFGTNMIEDLTQGIIVCVDCGQVNDNLYYNGPEKINYEDSDKHDNRYNIPINNLLPETSITTNISGHGCNKLKGMQRWGIPYKERSLKAVYSEIDSICYKNNILKSIEDDAKIMYKKITECKHQTGKNKGKFIITRGINRKSIIAACLYHACRKKKMSKTPKEIAKMFNISLMEMNKGSKNFDNYIDLNNLDDLKDNSDSYNSHYYIRERCEKIRMNEEYILKAINISKNIEKLDFVSTHTPYSVAAASILLMANTNNLDCINKKKISMLFEISEVTLNKTYKKLEEYKSIILNNDTTNNMLDKINIEKQNITVPQEILDRMKNFGISNNIIVEPESCDNEEYYQEDYSDTEIIEDNIKSDNDKINNLISIVYNSKKNDIKSMKEIINLRRKINNKFYD